MLTVGKISARAPQGLDLGSVGEEIAGEPSRIAPGEALGLHAITRANVRRMRKPRAMIRSVKDEAGILDDG